MVYTSRWKFEPQHVSVPTFVFGPPGSQLPAPTRRLFSDADHPDTRYITREMYRLLAQQFAVGLLDKGFQPGDRIMLICGNHIFIPVVIMGTIMAGGIYNSANPAFRARELAYQMKDVGPKFIFAARECLDTAYEAAGMSGIARESIFTLDDTISPFDIGKKSPESPMHWDNFFAPQERARTYAWEELNTPEKMQKVALLIYSSGTTGLPKGVEIRIYQVIATLKQTETTMFADKSITSRRSLAVLPCYHGYGIFFFGFLYPRNGVESFIMKRYELIKMLESIERFRVTELTLVPAIISAVLKSDAARSGKYNLSTVRKVICGAAPLGIEATKQFEDLWKGKVKVTQGWGMTECPVTTLGFAEDYQRTSSSISVGELMPGVEAKLILDDGSEETRPNHPGELFVRGPNVLTQYWNKPKATAEAKTADGWLKTGDTAIVDENMLWYIVDRKKDIMKVRGAQVAPAEIEDLLLEHPQVREAAVVGLPTPDGDTLPRAYVIAMNRRMVSAYELQEFVENRLVKQKRLKGGVVFVDELPKTPVGKVQRKVLQELANKEAQQETRVVSRL